MDSHSATAAKPRTRTHHSTLSKHATADGNKQETIQYYERLLWRQQETSNCITSYYLGFVLNFGLTALCRLTSYSGYELLRIEKFVVYKIESIWDFARFILLMRCVFFSLHSSNDELHDEASTIGGRWIWIHKQGRIRSVEYHVELNNRRKYVDTWKMVKWNERIHTNGGQRNRLVKFILYFFEIRSFRLVGRIDGLLVKIIHPSIWFWSTFDIISSIRSIIPSEFWILVA